MLILGDDSERISENREKRLIMKHYSVTSWIQTCGLNGERRSLNSHQIQFTDEDNCPENLSRILKKGRRRLREELKKYKKNYFCSTGIHVIDDITLWKNMNMNMDGLCRWVKVHAYDSPIIMKDAIK